MSSDIASGMGYPQANVAEQSRMELQARLNGLNGLGGRKVDSETKAKKLREACEGFESIFIQKMWQEMRNTVPKSNLLQGREEKYWQDMYDQELSKSMTNAGGIGLADMMFEQLSKSLTDASRETAQAGGGNAFTPSVAPLVAQASVKTENAAIPAAMQEKAAPPANLADVYDGEATQTPQPQMPEPEPRQYPERRHGLIHSETNTRKPGTKGAGDIYNSGMELAARAKRDAGDKLGARGIRPSLQQVEQSKADEQLKTAEQPKADKQPAFAAETDKTEISPQVYGTAESVQAALDKAKTGTAVVPLAQAQSMNALVAEVKLKNSGRSQVIAQANEMSNQQTSGSNNADYEMAEPVIRKTRYTTNIPGNISGNSKKGMNSNPIRMLNVDNASINSKQGKGLAAYHAAQETAGINSAGRAENNMAETAAKSANAADTEPPTFVIPPLRASSI